MQLPNVWETCKFSDEILAGVPDYSKFAVELHSVLDGTADEIYKNPNHFLNNTYLTSRMEAFLKDVLLRLGRNERQPVYVIDTEFGGGKTHTLLLLYHVLNNKGVGNSYIKKYDFYKKYDISEVPSTQVIAIDCRQIKRHTLWGEIAEKTGNYDKVKSLDNEKLPINDISLIKSFFTKPTVLLIDELPLYLLQADAEKLGNTTLAEVTVTFIQNLISAVSSVKNCVLVITLTAAQQLYEKYAGRVKQAIKRITDYNVDDLIGGMKEALSRQVQFVVPVDKKEVYNVVVTRLVKQINEKKKNEVIDSYYSYYEQKGILPEPDYRKKMEAAYPIHPFFIDTLYDRVSSIDKFNKTRGLLRLLALVLHNIHEKKDECKVVNLSNVDLSDDDISDELTLKLDRGYFKPVIESDCLSKAKNLDQSKIIKVFEKIARSVFMYSLIGAAKIHGIRPADVKLAVCEPGMDASLIEKALDEIDREFWYIRSEGQEYYFDKEPNINRIIHDYLREVTDNEVHEKIRKVLENDLLKQTGGVSTAVWDLDKLEDNETLKIFALDYDDEIDEGNAKVRLAEIFEKNVNGSIRSYQNTLVFLFPEKAGIDTLTKAARLVCAIEKTMKDERVRLNKENLKKVDGRLEDAKGQLLHECMSVYSKVAYPNGPSIRIDTISAMESKSSELTSAVLSLLRKHGKLVDNLNNDVIVDIVKDRGIIKVSDIYQLFKKDRSQRFVTTGSVIIHASVEAVKTGKLGYSSVTVERDGKYEGKTGSNVTNVGWDEYLIDSARLLIPERDDQIKKECPPGHHWDADLQECIKDTEPQPPSQYIYRFTLNDMDDIVKILTKVPIIMVGGKRTVRLNVHLENESDTITIESRLKNINEMNSLLKQLSNRFKATGKLILDSNEDLSEELASYGLEADKN
jgi:hypothetical protein